MEFLIVLFLVALLSTSTANILAPSHAKRGGGWIAQRDGWGLSASRNFRAELVEPTPPHPPLKKGREKLGEKPALQRRLDQLHCIPNPIKRGERPKPWPFLFTQQNLIQHVEPALRHADGAVFLRGGVRFAAADFIDFALNFFSCGTVRQIAYGLFSIALGRGLSGL